jgi:hypothetical protein
LENFFEKKFSKPFKKLYLKPLCGFRRIRARARPWKTFLKKSFPNLSKNFTRNRFAGSEKHGFGKT